MIPTRIKSIEGISRTLAIISLFCLILFLSAPVALSKESEFNLDPLRPADTSSPRDTLNSFLTGSNLYIEDFRRKAANEKTFRAYRRASQTLDFSTTPGGDTWFVRSQRMALLQELLARIELPPANEIPSDDEVADGAITPWTFPNTGITIEKIEQGPRAGQFLFSAETVQSLDRLYRQVKQLPYRPGATVGVYEQMVSAETGVHVQEQQLRTRLKPIDTSSPRSIFERFLDSVNRAYGLVMETKIALQAIPPTMTGEEARSIEKMANNLLQRASDTLDLSEVPKRYDRTLASKRCFS